MSTLSNGRRTHNRSVVGEPPAVVTAYVTVYAVGTENDGAEEVPSDELGHQRTAAIATTSAMPTPAEAAPVRPRRRRGTTGWPVLGGRGGALTLAPWPSVLVITSSVQLGLGTPGA